MPPADHRNLRLEISFDGRAFNGYQFQPNGKTVQELLTKAWELLTHEQVLLFGCSRLDAGVHASHFVVNLYSRTHHSCDRILRSLNGILCTAIRGPISILSVSEVDARFHARYDSVGKHYRYLFWYGRGAHALWAPRCWTVRSPVEPAGLDSILREFEGTHDFAAFRAQDCTAKTTERTIFRIDFWRHPRIWELGVVDVWGDGFLKNMVRNLVGTAMDIATGRLPANSILQGFEHRDRSRIGQCAPAHGLALEKVYYSMEELQIDARSGVPFLLS
jgi:tRNA pseudouridine38-40 synthase